MFSLFFVGIIEMIIMTVWTNVVTKTQVLASGFITIVNILIWYYVLETIVSNLDSVSLVMMYALGCAIGTMIGTYFFGQEGKRVIRKARNFRKKNLNKTGSENSLNVEVKA
jgi:Domain of unknown function (DUF5698)